MYYQSSSVCLRKTKPNKRAARISIQNIGHRRYPHEGWMPRLKISISHLHHGVANAPHMSLPSISLLLPACQGMSLMLLSKLHHQRSAPNLRLGLTEAGFAWGKLFGTLILRLGHMMNSRYYRDISTRPEEARTRGLQLFMSIRGTLVITVGYYQSLNMLTNGCLIANIRSQELEHPKVVFWFSFASEGL